MKYINDIEKFASIAKYIWEFGNKYGLGGKGCDNDGRPKHHQICSLDFEEGGITGDEFKKIFDTLVKKELIEIENGMAVPCLNSDGSVYRNQYGEEVDSDEWYFGYIIRDLDKLKRYFIDMAEGYPKRDKPFIKIRALEVVAKKIGELETGVNLIKILKSCGVNPKTIVYPNIKWVMVLDVLEYLAYSSKEDDKKILFKILEEFSHPLTFDGDKTEALKIQDFFTNCLEYDGYCINKGKVTKVTEDKLESIGEEINKKEDLEELIIEVVPKPRRGEVYIKIKGYDKIVFSGRRAQILEFLYNKRGGGDWFTSQDLKLKTAKQLRQAVEGINKKVDNDTKHEYSCVIMSKEKSENSTKQNEYRWGVY